MSLNWMPGFGKSGMLRMNGVRSMMNRPLATAAAARGQAYGTPTREATMPTTIRRAAPADAAVIAEFNRLLAAESEGIALDVVTLAAGVAAVLGDPAKGVYFVAQEE